MRKNAMIDAIKRLPRITWAMVALAFLLGLLLRVAPSSRSGEKLHLHENAEAHIWTCSMYPQIKLSEPGQCPICFMDLIPLEADDDQTLDATALKMSEAAMALAEIVTLPVVFAPAEGTLHLSGKVTVDESRTGKIAAYAAGRLEKLYVDFTGTTVNEGDPLVELYSPALYAAQEELLQGRKTLGAALSNVQRRAARFTVDASREKLRQLGLNASQVEAIERRGTASDRIIIFSPLSGVVTHKNAVEGLYVQAGTPLYTVADLSSLWVSLDVYELEIGQLAVGQSARFTVGAFPGLRFEGSVAFVDPLFNDRTRTASARLNVENGQGRLKPGMFVRAEVTVTSARPVLQVPVSAVMKTGKRAIVYIQKPDTEAPVFELREIGLGQRYGEVYAVEFGLAEGERVVVHGNFKIDSAMQIAAKPSMMNPEGGMSGAGHAHHGQGREPASSDPSAESPPDPALRRFNVPIAFLKKLSPVYHHYFTAQAALANDDFAAAVEALATLDDSLNGVSVSGFSTESKAAWQDIANEIHQEMRHAAHWSDIETARIAFEPISLAMLKMQRAFGHVGETAHFEVFCPMAFNDRGAPWLQNHDTVDNPYFGDQMLRCGEVRRSFEPRK